MVNNVIRWLTGFILFRSQYIVYISIHVSAFSLIYVLLHTKKKALPITHYSKDIEGTAKVMIVMTV